MGANGRLNMSSLETSIKKGVRTMKKSCRFIAFLLSLLIISMLFATSVFAGTLPASITLKEPEWITDTNARLKVLLHKQNGVSITSVAWYLGEKGQELSYVFGEEVPDSLNRTYRNYHAWLNITDEGGLVLSPGTEYEFKCIAYCGDAAYESPIGTFTTTGIAPVNPEEASTPTVEAESQDEFSDEAQKMLAMLERSNYNPRPLAEYDYAYEVAGDRWTPSEDKMINAYYSALLNMVNKNTNTHLEYTDGFMQRFISAYIGSALDLEPWVQPVAEYILNSNEGTEMLQTIDILVDLRMATTNSDMKTAIDKLVNQCANEVAELAELGLDVTKSTAVDSIIEIIAEAKGLSSGMLSFIASSVEFLIEDFNASTMSNYSVKAYQQIRETFWTMYGERTNIGDYTSDTLETMRQYYRYIYYLTQEQYSHAANVMGAEKWWKDEQIQADSYELGQILSVVYYPYSE